MQNPIEATYHTTYYFFTMRSNAILIEDKTSFGMSTTFLTTTQTLFVLTCWKAPNSNF